MDQEPLSPFIAGTHIQWAWDSTSLGYLKECPKKYHYTMIEGWRSKHSSVHLFFGGLYHSAIEHYEKRMFAGATHDEALLAVTREALIASHPWAFDHNLKTRETLIRSIVWYLEHFKEDASKTVVLASGAPAVELSFRFDINVPVGEQSYILCGHLDQIVDLNGELYVQDHKATSMMPTQRYFDQFNPDNQMSLYTLASRVVYGLPVKGIIIDAAQIAVGFTRFERGLTYRTEEQVQEWLDDTVYWLRMAERYAEQEHWPRNDLACHRYDGCAFREVCSKSPQVRQSFLETKFMKGNAWNPLKVR